MKPRYLPRNTLPSPWAARRRFRLVAAALMLAIGGFVAPAVAADRDVFDRMGLSPNADVDRPSSRTPAPREIEGTGRNFGRGWRSDGAGGYQGTGDNFGRGYRPDGRGGAEGYGRDFGRGYSSPADKR